MAETLTIARPYAEAVFRLASGAKALPQWSTTLQLLAAVAAEPKVKGLVGDPNRSPAEIEKIFVDVCGKELNQGGTNLVALLIRNERMSVLPEIVHLFEALKAEAESVLKARIVSAFPLADSQVAPLIERLEKRYGRKVEPEVVVDEELIGGVKIEVGDEVLDASVKAKLQDMALALTR